jgi:serine phosphatase RsbU (regulator of sigma subunit)
VNPRRSDEKFVTLWVGVFDAASGTLSYVDAGHGYAMMLNPGGTFTMLAEGDGLPIGLYADAEYKAITVALAPGGRAMVISDGIVEQYGPVPAADGTPTNEHFNVEGVQRVITKTPADDDPVTALFDAVVKHAATTTLQDDATAVLVKW